MVALLKTIFVPRSRCRYLRNKHFAEDGSKIILLSLRCRSIREVQCPVLEKLRIPRGRQKRQKIDSLPGRFYGCMSTS